MADLVPVPSGAPPLPARRDAFGDPREEGIDWRRSLAAIQRYRWWILLLTLLGAAGGFLTGRILPPSYLAEATIWIQASEPRGAAYRGPIGADQLLPAFASVDLLESFVVLDDVVRERRLYLRAPGGLRDAAVLQSLRVADTYQPGSYVLRVDPGGRTYQLTTERDIVLERGSVGDSVGRAVGIRWAPAAALLDPDREVPFRLVSLRDAATFLASELASEVDQTGNFLRVALTGENPEATAATVNAVVDRFIAVSTELKRAKLIELSRLLDEQLAAAGENLRRAESELAGFRARTITLGPPPPPATAGTATTPLAGTDY
ncbi:MAG: hypothetical protein ACREME_00775, partial [Gemmatimonadales bacterium]